MKSRNQEDELSAEAIELIASRFKVLSDPVRLTLLHRLGQMERSVGELARATGYSQANVSKHLSILLDAGFVGRRKDGLNVFYAVSDKSIFDICRIICSMMNRRISKSSAAVRNYSQAQGHVG
jgi:DNA-binding transcriptional ArsR family regulator